MVGKVALYTLISTLLIGAMALMAEGTGAHFGPQPPVAAMSGASQGWSGGQGTWGQGGSSGYLSGASGGYGSGGGSTWGGGYGGNSPYVTGASRGYGGGGYDDDHDGFDGYEGYEGGDD